MQTNLRRLLQSTAAVAAVIVFAAPLANAEPPDAESQITPYAVQKLGNPTPPAAPPRPFYANFQVLNSALSAGPLKAKLAVTNITLTNFDTSVQQVFIFAPLFAAGGKCGDPVVGGTSPQMYLIVQPSQTLVIPYPTPLVIDRLRPNCIAAEVTTTLHSGSVAVSVNGFIE